jgi:ATP-binding cassette subfamily C exporter for protease/lipase
MQRQSSSLRALYSLLFELRRELILVGALSLAVNMLMLSPSLYMLQVYDRVMISHNELTLAFSTVLLVMMLTLVAWFEQLRTGLLVRLGIAFDRSIQSEIFFSSLHGELKKPSANPLQGVFDLAQIRQFITSQGLFALFDAPWFFIYAGVLFLMHPLLGFVGLLFAAIQVAFIVHSKKFAAPLIQATNQQQVRLQALQQSQLRNTESIQALGMLPTLKQRWATVYGEWHATHSHAEHDAQKRSSFTKFMRYTQQSLSLGVGAVLVIHGDISAGAMIATNILMTRMLQPLDSLTGTWRAWLNMQAALARVETQTNLNIPPHDIRPVTNLPTAPIRVRTVGLRAKSAEPAFDILTGVSIDIAAGSAVALLGNSGAGKTSLALALLGLLPNSEGNVYWDAEGVTYLSTPDWHSAIGYLPQQVEFISGTVAQNIARFGSVNADAVVAAAVSAQAHDMILRLPKGYDTLIGPQGLAISSGQKQRIGLARALFGGPKLLILDEPDSHLDDAGEMAFKEAFETIKSSGCTLILITHRKRLLSLCDRLFVMESGRIARELPQSF